MTNPNATATEDAFVRIEINEGIIVAYGQVSASARNRFGLNFIEIGEFL
jgi:hypothetical protein